MDAMTTTPKDSPASREGQVYFQQGSRAERYSDFAALNARNGRFDPGLAMLSLLHSLSPDTRAFIIRMMEFGKEYLRRELTDHGRGVLRGCGADAEQVDLMADIVRTTGFRREYSDNFAKSFQLAKMGAIRVGRRMVDGEDLATYALTLAGEELFKPLIDNAIMFIDRAAAENNHRFDSTYRLLGVKGRPANVEMVLSELCTSGPMPEAEIKRRLRSSLTQAGLSMALRSMAYAGLIRHESLTTHMLRKDDRVHKKYALRDIRFLGMSDEQIFDEVKGISDYRMRLSHVTVVANLFARNPNKVIDIVTAANEIRKTYASAGKGQAGMKISRSTARITAGYMLEKLTAVGMLRLERGFRGNDKSLSSATALGVTFNDEVLKWARMASRLEYDTLRRPMLTKEMVLHLIENYQSEKGDHGRPVTQEELDEVESFIRKKGPVHMRNLIRWMEINRIRKNVTRDTVRKVFIMRLVEAGKIEHMGDGYYRAT